MDKQTIEDLYNMLMLDIEPELVTYMLPELPSMYEQETPEDRRTRLTRYASAFETFAERFAMLIALWTQELKHFKQNVFATLKERAGTEDAAKLEELSRSFEKP